MAKRIKTRDMVLTALFIALVFLLGLTPVGLIPLGFINVTVLCIPVVVGTILFGLKVGLLLGGCMGTVSLMSVLGLSLTPPSGLAAALLAASPVLAVLMCFVPRLLIPVATHFVYRWVARGKEEESKLGIAPAAVAGSLTNTVFYLGMMLLFYVMAGLDSKPILALIGGVALVAGSLEAVAAAVIATPVVIALRKAGLVGGPKEPEDEPEGGAQD